MHNPHTLSEAIRFVVIFLLSVVAVSVILYRILESIEESERNPKPKPQSASATTSADTECKSPDSHHEPYS
jgi:hypothetical protein